MKLKEVQMFGFKSFADKTTLEFNKGITIIVGPNGSGKSNIMDGIRWVLGEQSAKSLRGGKMEDVIFAGSDTRKTLGIAEVSLVLDNDDKRMAIPYNEIKFTRRLYRSGESEYFINDNQVRLKDISEMLMGTGLGIDSYSIIGQGEVDRIINAKAIERREIFEEAAGITKYITKRDEALRRLESTEQNMVRINDILSEVKRQMGSLEKQAKKAEKYKVLREELNGMLTKVYMRDIKNMNNEYKKYSAANDDIEKQIQEESSGINKNDALYAEMKQKSADLEREINEKREKFLLKEQEIKRLEDNLGYLSEKTVELGQRSENLKNENIENVGKVQGIKIDMESKETALKDREKAISEGEKELENILEKYNSVLLEQDAIKSELEEKKLILEKLNQEINALNNKIIEEDLRIENIDGQILKNTEGKKAFEEKARKLGLDLDLMSKNKVLKEEEINSIKSKEEFLIKDKISRKEALEAVNDELREVTVNTGKAESRLNLLKEMKQRFEGYGEIIRKILTQYRKTLAVEDRQDIVDVIGNLLSVEKPYETAIEKTLAHILKTLLVRKESHIKEIFRIYESEKGEVGFLSAENPKVDFENILAKWKDYIKHPDIMAYLPDILKVEQQNAIIKVLFYNIYIVDGMEKAQKVLMDVKKDEEYFLLTLSGELISNFNTYRRGEGADGLGTGFLSREREMNEISSEIVLLKEKLSSLETDKKSREKEIENMETEIEELSRLYHSQYIEVIKDAERSRQKEEDKKISEEETAKLAAAITSLESDKGSSKARKESVAREIQKMQDETEKMKAEIANVTAGLQGKEEELASRKNIIEDAKVESTKAKGDFELESNNLSMLGKRLEELDAAYNSTAREIEEINLKITQAGEEKQANETKIQELRSTLSADENEWNVKKTELEALKAEMEKIEQGIKLINKGTEILKEKQYEIKLKINELSLEIKALYSKLDEELKVAPDEAALESFELAEEEYRELNLKITDSRERMESLGVINLVAIEEYSELQKRNDFLQAQYDDLFNARENLKKVIKKTNDESKELFEKAFEEVRKKFADVFQKMMNGGEADLLLLDRENILESGIDIIARPPGKKLQNISLMSGGEKAITAISLLFALFLIKTSPFCCMDEIDAPLDDMNIMRFVNLVRSFRERTQFLIISHNKITMETANVLYGVSMEKNGVSKIMSVKLDTLFEKEDAKK